MGAVQIHFFHYNHNRFTDLVEGKRSCSDKECKDWRLSCNLVSGGCEGFEDKEPCEVRGCSVFFISFFKLWVIVVEKNIC